MDITFIAITMLILFSTLFLGLFLFKSINRKAFIADDGSEFYSQSDLDLYQSLYEKTKPLFSDLEMNNSSQDIMGFQKIFLTKLTTEGFIDLRTLLKYRAQLKLLSDLINP